MRFYDIIILFLVLAIFSIVYFINISTIGIQNIKKNWNRYRCNPMIMPFANYFGYDPYDNFVQCIATIQTKNMTRYLNPIEYILQIFQQTVDSALKSVDSTRSRFSFLTSNITNIFEQVFGIFNNITIAMQEVIIRLRDMLSKLLATSIVMAHMVDGSSKTGLSVVKGPIGKTINFICFAPSTTIHLKNGIHKAISHSKIGDILEDGTEIIGVLRLKGNTYCDINPDGSNDFYRIYDHKYKEWIYVSGMHFVYDEKVNDFVRAKNHNDSIHVNDIKSPVLYCLITNTHKIQIGSRLFWDWEDAELEYNEECDKKLDWV